MSLSKILKTQHESFLQVKKGLEESRFKQPDATFSVELRKRNIATLKTRIKDLKIARDKAINDFDETITRFESKIKRLEAENERDTPR